MNIVALAVAAALAVGGSATPAVDCTVTDATLTWGFKESFRSYISGTIANGEWTVADGATYKTPSFGWADGTGTLDAGVGTVAFVGSIEFTGHGGILDTTVANPRLVFNGTDAATLLLDVAGTTQQGAAIDAKAVPFATVDLGATTWGDGTVTLEAAPATLTAKGAAAFGTYEAGEALDPISATISADPACTVAPAGAPWLPLLVGWLVVVAALAVVLVAAERRATARAHSATG